jgi:phosphonate transport system permease protein
VSLVADRHADREVDDDGLNRLLTAEFARSSPREVNGRSGLVRLIAALTVGLAVWTVWAAGIGRRRIANPGGWPITAKFLRAAVRPDLSAGFLARTGRAALVTISYGALGTALSLAIGVAGGIAISRSVWRRRLAGSQRIGIPAGIVRLALLVPRGIHEAVWGLLFVNLLGRNPLVAVLAIGFPFGAITAKVYADLIDGRSTEVSRQLRFAGAGRMSALAYGAIPATASDLVSYAFYRFECSMRSAVVLGMVGAGGIGFQLTQSFQGLAYRELWTSIYALIALGLLAELWSAVVRADRRGARRWSSIGALAVVVLAWFRLSPHVGSLWSARTRREVARLATKAFPPKLPKGGWRELYDAAATTLQMSFLAIVIAVAVAVPVALLGARTTTQSSRRRHGVGVMARFVALTARSIPSTVWALVVLFIILPGIVPGAIALGIYTFGVLARLFGEALENADRSASAALRAMGAGTVSSFGYGTLPTLAPIWASFSLYRWEVAAREAAVVGVVGAGGLGRLLGEQTAGFAYAKMFTTIAALVVVTMLVDQLSTAIAKVLR